MLPERASSHRKWKSSPPKSRWTFDRLMELMAEGRVIIPANKRHSCLDPNGIGSMLKTKINVNLGTSRDCSDLEKELEKGQ